MEAIRAWGFTGACAGRDCFNGAAEGFAAVEATACHKKVVRRSWHLLIALRHWEVMILIFFSEHSTLRRSQMERGLLLVLPSGYENLKTFAFLYKTFIVWFFLLLHQATRGSCEHCGPYSHIFLMNSSVFLFNLVFDCSRGVPTACFWISGAGKWFSEYILTHLISIQRRF